MNKPKPRKAAASPEAPFVTVGAAAQQLGLSATSVQMLVERGLLQAWRTAGGHRRILAESVTALLRSRGGSEAAAAAATVGARSPRSGAFDLLVAEDDPDLLRLYRTRLKLPGEEVQLRFAEDGVQALLAIGQKAPDALILDLDLPGINGVDALHSLRSDRRTAHMPVIVVSGVSKNRIEAMGGLPPGSVVLSKPVPFDRLLGCLEAFAAVRQLG